MRKRIVACTLCLVTLGLGVEDSGLHAQVNDHVEGHKVTIHELESFELVGTRRVSKQLLIDEFGLVVGTKLDDEFVMATRQKLLSLGLFRNVLLFQKKGSRPGLARLIIEVEDDERVLSSWALGGSVGLFYDDPVFSSIDPETDRFNYSLNLVSRNLFQNLHRGSASLDIDSAGKVRSGRLLYGLPRFAKENVQFDVEASAVDVRSRYLDAMGYGGKVQGIWTKSTGEADIFFGPAMYFNRTPRFGFKENPESTAGPRLGYARETRLLGFVPRGGYAYSGSVLCSVVQYDESILELSGAYTFNFWEYLFWTIDAKTLSIGSKAFSARGETKFDIPLSAVNANVLQSANLFLRLRAGKDKTKDRSYTGSSAIVGVQYFSSGFIASFGFQITKSPSQFLRHADQSSDPFGGEQ